MKLSLSIVATLVAAAQASTVPSLTPDNFESITAGKTVFIKFFAPWYVDQTFGFVEYNL